MPNWKARLTGTIDALAERRARETVEANAEMIGRTLAGLGPEGTEPKAGEGIRAVVNIAAVHVPAFCDASNGWDDAYKNAYDLEKVQPLGEGIDGYEDIPTRVRVDAAIEATTGVPQENLYFAAAELNGCGIRFYGDLCLVLTEEHFDAGTHLLVSNSYDAVRPPNMPTGSSVTQQAIEGTIENMLGKGRADLSDVAAEKILALRGDTDRRLTTGQVSEALLEDEDYIEILLPESFDVEAVREVRTTAADAALEGQIARDTMTGPAPGMAEMEWRNQRRAAARALDQKGTPSRTVTTAGRVKP